MNGERHFLRGADGHLIHNAAGHLVAVPCPCCPEIRSNIILTITGMVPNLDCLGDGGSGRARWTAPLTADPNRVIELADNGGGPNYDACWWHASVPTGGEISGWNSSLDCSGTPSWVLPIGAITYDMFRWNGNWQLEIDARASSDMFSNGWVLFRQNLASSPIGCGTSAFVDDPAAGGYWVDARQHATTGGVGSISPA